MSDSSRRGHSQSDPDSPSNGLSWTIALEARFQNLDRARDFVAEAAAACGLEPAAVYAVQLAVDEAITNIIEHAYGGECQELVECTCRDTRQSLVIELRDCGQPFDPTIVPNPDLTSNLEDRDIGGLGLYFMHEMMDEVSFQFYEDARAERNCNLLTMVKHKEN